MFRRLPQFSLPVQVRRTRKVKARPSFESMERRDVPAVALPTGFTESVLVADLQSTTMTQPLPDGRILLGRLNGTIQMVKDGQLQPAPVAQFAVTNRFIQGLMGLTIDPNFSQNHYLYVYKVVDSGTRLRNQLSRVTLNGDAMVPGSETILFTSPKIWFEPGSGGHNGGGIVIGPDNKFYIPTGDLDQGRRVQGLDTLAGKILRLNLDGSIPKDNPFYKTTKGVYRAIYAIGTRNPYSIAMQEGTGIIYVNDVGGSNFEEINQIAAGANYGWPVREGYSYGRKFTTPVYAYSHNDPDTDPGGTAVVGGAFYSMAGASFPSQYNGQYFFGDYHNGWIKTLDPATHQVHAFATGLPEGIVDIDLTADGRLIYLVLNPETASAELHQIVYAPADPPALPKLDNVRVSTGYDAVFRTSPAGTGPFTYKWFVNNTEQIGFNGPSFSLPGQLNYNGFHVHAVVTNQYGVSTTNKATLTVINDQPPTVEIHSPIIRRVLSAGKLLRFNGYAMDIEDGRLPDSAFFWTIDILHNQHSHPHTWQLVGKSSGKFRIPHHADTGRIAFRLNVTVTDSAGNTATTSRVFETNVGMAGDGHAHSHA